MSRDIIFAIRSFRAAPAFVAVVVVSIALGIAANTTVFSIANALLFGSLPVPEPDRLLSFSEGRTLSYSDYKDYRDQTADVFAGVSAHFPVLPASVGGRGDPERVWGQLVSGNYFEIIGLPMALGRGILPREDRMPGGDPVVVLSDGLWRRRFGADPAIVGRDIVLNGARYTVVGVTPRSFRGVNRGFVPEFWAPLGLYAQLMPDLDRDGLLTRRNYNWLCIDARLRHGVTRKQAVAAVNVVKRRLDEAWRKADRRLPPITLTPSGGLSRDLSRHALSLMTVLAVVVGLVLAIACANVANVLLARATGRRKEISVRLAVGAGRWRLIRQLLIESLLLSAAGAVVGLALAFGATWALSSFRLPLPLPLVFDFRPDARVLAFTALLSVFTGLLFGLAPALRATNLDLVTSLKDGGSFGPGRRFGLRGALVVVQVSLSFVLLVGSGLFLRSLRASTTADLGMRPDNVLIMAFDPKLHRYTPDQTRQFLAQLRGQVEALPGVSSVSFLDSIPLSLGGSSSDFALAEEDARRLNADVYITGSRFFTTMGLPLLRGRDFTANDRNTVIINQTMAERLFGRDDPLGRKLRSEDTDFTVIGLARNAKSRFIGETPQACAYMPLEGRPEKVFSFFGISIAVKTAVHPRTFERAVRDRIAALDANMAVFNTETMQEHLDKALMIPRVCATLLGVFGGVGLTLAAIGLYGVMSFAVRRRTREIGIRIALGAHSGRVLRSVMAQGLALAGMGVIIGLAVAFALSRFAVSLLYGVDATDPATFAGVPVVLLGVAALAIFAPARRAASIEPMRALRHE